jgi:hypothetical protein
MKKYILVVLALFTSFNLFSTFFYMDGEKIINNPYSDFTHTGPVNTFKEIDPFFPYPSYE